MSSIFAAARERLAHLSGENGPKLLRDLVSLFGGQGFSMVVSFLAFAYAARQLSPADYGTVELAISIAAFWAIVIECGAGTIGVRELSRNRASAANIAGQVVVARLMVTAVVMPVAAIMGYLVAPDAAALALIWLFVISLLAAPFKQEWLLQGHDMMHQAALAQPIRMLAFAAGMFLFLRSGTSAVTIGWIELAAVALVTVYYLFAQYRWTVPFGRDWPRRAAFYYLREGVSVGLANMLWAFMLYAPIYLLATFGDAEGAAWLGASNRIVISLVTLSFIYHFNLYPVITKLVHENAVEWAQLMSASVQLVAFGATAIALALTLYAAEIMGLVFGESYRAAAPALIVLSWALPLRMLSGHSRWSLIAAGAQKYLLRAEIAGSAALLAIALVLIPRIGATGAALAFLTGLGTSFVVTQSAVVREIARFRLFTQAGPPIAGAAACVLAAGQFDLGLIARGVLAAVVMIALAALNRRGLRDDLIRLAYAKEALR